MADFIYQEDRTGTAAANRIPEESHMITPAEGKTFSFIIPKFAPYYLDSMNVYIRTNGTLLPMTRGLDWEPSLHFRSASLSVSKSVYGGVSLVDLSLDDEIVLGYQTVGGGWVLDDQAMIRTLAEIIYNPRGLTWDQLSNTPTNFGVTEHSFDFNTVLTEAQLGVKIDGIAAAILANNNSPSTPPVAGVPTDVGLGNVANYSVATTDQTLAGDTNKYLTPAVFMAALQQLGLLGLSSTLLDYANHKNTPNAHGVTKHHIELDLVENYPVASVEDVLAARPVKKYVLLEDLIRFINVHGGTGSGGESEQVQRPPKDALLSTFCQMRNNIGIFADGYGGTYQKLIEGNSVDCGYVRPTSAPAYPIRGTLLSSHCIEKDKYGIYADGYGNTFTNLLAARSIDCGYCASDSPCATNVPAGQVLNTYCEGRDQIRQIADGRGGFREERTTNHPSCDTRPKPPAGTLLRVYCNGWDQMGEYADGEGNTYNAVVVKNSVDCGWTAAPTAAPTTAPTFIPANTPIREYCHGTTKMGVFANGVGGEYERILQSNSSECITVTNPPAGTVLSVFCQGNNQVTRFADGSGGYNDQITQVAHPDCAGVTAAPTAAPGSNVAAGDGISIAMSGANAIISLGPVHGWTEEFQDAQVPGTGLSLRINKKGQVLGWSAAPGTLSRSGGDALNGWRCTMDGWIQQWGYFDFPDFSMAMTRAFTYHHEFASLSTGVRITLNTTQPVLVTAVTQETATGFTMMIHEANWQVGNGRIRWYCEGQVSDSKRNQIWGIV